MDRKPTLGECVAAVMAHQWSNNQAAMDALTQLVDAANAAGDVDILAEHRRIDGQREWVSVGVWLRPGEVVAHMDDPRRRFVGPNVRGNRPARGPQE